MMLNRTLMYMSVLTLVIIVLCITMFKWKDMPLISHKQVPKKKVFQLLLDNDDDVLLRQMPDPLTKGRNHINYIPPESEMQKLETQQLAKMYHSYMINTEILCKRLLRMGNVGEGGYNICNDKRFQLRQPCLVYSFGIRNDFSFDDSINKTYHCEIHSFDPSMKMADKTKRAPNMVFHNVGLSNFNGILKEKQWPMKTLKYIKQDLHHSKKPLDLLKMDIDFSEWDALPEILESGEIRFVRQLVAEFHLSDKPEPRIPKKTFISRLKLVRKLQQTGFRVVYSERNPLTGFYSKIAREMRGKYHNVLMIWAIDGEDERELSSVLFNVRRSVVFDEYFKLDAETMANNLDLLSFLQQNRVR